jgi:hypothetical protein
VAGVLLVWAALVAASLLSARANVLEARHRMEAGRDALRNGDLPGAEEELTAAGAAFARAERRFANPPVGAVRRVPAVGAPLERMADATAAGRLIAGAGREVVGALRTLPEGADSLVPSAGRIPVEPLLELAPGIERARALVEEAAGIIDRAPGAWLPASVAKQDDALLAELGSLRGTLAIAEALTRELPAFLGVDGPRRYFLGAQNPAELRGTGGFIGAFAIVTVDDGLLAFDDFAPIQDLPNLPPEAVIPPDPSYAARYDRYGGAGFWMNINMTPDFPSASRAIEELYGRVTGTRLDGVVVVDPAILATLLELSGPLEHPEFGRLDADSVVAFLANESYARFGERGDRKQVLGKVATDIIERFLAGRPDGDLLNLAEKVSRVATEGHLLVHAVDPDVQAAFDMAGVAGSLASDHGDYLAVVGNNAAGNKIDYYANRSVHHRVDLQPDGGALAVTEVRLRNSAPTQGQPRHIIGPWSQDYIAGENVTIVSTYCRPGCRLVEFSRDGVAGTARSEQELGRPVFTATTRVPSDEEEILGYRFAVPQAWTANGEEGVYRFTYQGQPTIRPTSLTLDVALPDGYELVEATPESERHGGRVVWQGQPGRQATVELRFARPPRPALQRGWDAVWRFLSRPLFRLPLGSMAR